MQTVAANEYSQLGYPVAFPSQGVLVVRQQGLRSDQVRHPKRWLRRPHAFTLLIRRPFETHRDWATKHAQQVNLTGAVPATLTPP